MARQNINVGTVANDGTGDTLRNAGQKINQNFAELYNVLGGDSASITDNVALSDSGIIFYGATNRLILAYADPGATDVTILLPDSNGTVVLSTASQTLTNKTLVSAVAKNLSFVDIDSSHNYTLVPGDISKGINVNVPGLSDSDTLVFEEHTQTLTNKTLTTPTISSPRITTGIFHTDGNELIKFSPQGTAVNEVTVANASTGNKPTMSATGTDTNITLKLAGKGTGTVEIQAPSFSATTITSTTSGGNGFGTLLLNPTVSLILTLQDGVINGEHKTLVNIGSGIATVTPSNFANGTSVVMNPNAALQMVWGPTQWYMIGENGDSSDYFYIV
jgi:hypothetical protein